MTDACDSSVLSLFVLAEREILYKIEVRVNVRDKAKVMKHLEKQTGDFTALRDDTDMRGLSIQYVAKVSISRRSRIQTSYKCALCCTL